LREDKRRHEAVIKSQRESQKKLPEESRDASERKEKRRKISKSAEIVSSFLAAHIVE